MPPNAKKGGKEVGFDPKRSKVNEDKLAHFLRQPLSGNLEEVPNIGDKTVQRLAEGDGEGRDCITNTYQLIGKFLSLRPDEADPVEHLDMFWSWLDGLFPSGATGAVKLSRSGIVQSIAQKVNMVYPGIYNPDLYS